MVLFCQCFFLAHRHSDSVLLSLLLLRRQWALPHRRSSDCSQCIYWFLQYSAVWLPIYGVDWLHLTHFKYGQLCESECWSVLGGLSSFHLSKYHPFPRLSFDMLDLLSLPSSISLHVLFSLHLLVTLCSLQGNDLVILSRFFSIFF